VPRTRRRASIAAAMERLVRLRGDRPPNPEIQDDPSGRQRPRKHGVSSDAPSTPHALIRVCPYDVGGLASL